MVGAGILAPLHDVAVLHEQHLAAGGAHHLHAVPQGGGEGQGLPEHAPRLQPLQDGTVARVVQPHQLRLPADQHPHLPGALAVGADDLSGMKPAPAHAEALDHRLHLLVRDVVKECQTAVLHSAPPLFIFNILYIWGQSTQNVERKFSRVLHWQHIPFFAL